jgi:hypothetical protein
MMFKKWSNEIEQEKQTKVKDSEYVPLHISKYYCHVKQQNNGPAIVYTLAKRIIILLECASYHFVICLYG